MAFLLPAIGNATTKTKFAYVVSQISNTTPGTVAVINTATGRAVGNIDVGESPQAIAVSPDGGTAYVTNYQGNSLSYFSTATLNPTVNTITSMYLNDPQGIAITPNGNVALVTNYGGSTCGNTVSIVNTGSKTVTGNLTVGNCPESVAVTPNGDTALVVNQHDGTVSVIDLTQTPPVVKSGSGYPLSLGLSQPYQVAITPNGNTALVTAYGSNSVGVIDLTQTPPVVKSGTGYPVSVGHTPYYVGISPDGTLAYVPNSGDGTVSVIDLTQSPPVAKSSSGYPISVGTSGSEVAAVAFTPDGSNAYVGGFNSTWIINTTTNAVKSITTGTGPSNDNFGSSIAFTPAPPPVAVAYTSSTGNITGDFNGDGKPDFAVITSTQVTTYFGDGAGNITSSHTYTFPHSWSFGTPVTSGSTIIVGDFNDDGKTDFILVQNTSVYSFLSNGDGTYSEPTTSPYYYTFPNSWAFGTPVTSAYTPIVGDFDGDGKTDFALVGSTQVFTFKSNGDGTFSALDTTSPYYYTFPHSWAFGGPPGSTYAPVVGDLNGDGRTDFAFVGGTEVFSFTSNGDGTYSVPNATSPYYYTLPNSWNFGTPLSSSYNLIAADLNGDGLMDFALLGTSQVFSFKNNGDGTFPTLDTVSPYYVTVPSGWGFGTPPSAGFTPIAGDLNGDGKVDFALLGSTQVFTFESNGNGTYTTPSYYTIPSGWGFGSPPSAIYTTTAFGGGPMLILVSSTNGFTLTSNGDGTYTAYDYSL